MKYSRDIYFERYYVLNNILMPITFINLFEYAPKHFFFFLELLYIFDEINVITK